MHRLLLLLALVACPELEPPISAKCVKQYEKCKLPDGPLGVCEPIACPSGEPGCFKCNPQH